MTHQRSPLHILVVQANPVAGGLETNVQTLCNILTKAKHYETSHHKKIDLVVFPEAFLSGYPVDDLVMNAQFMRSVEKSVHAISNFVADLNGPAVLFGAPEEGATRPFNSAYMIYPDGSKKVARKYNLPNDGPFDEQRVFEKGDLRSPFPLNGYQIGVVICEEMWHNDVPEQLASELADCLLVINGSPYTRNKSLSSRIPHARQRTRETQLPLIYCNMVGGQDELVFDGDSFAMGYEGDIIYRAEKFESSFFLATLNDNREMNIADFSPFSKDQKTIYDTLERKNMDHSHHGDDYSACVLALRDYVEKLKFQSVVIGISGGVDSALVAAMAVDAIGKDRVIGITMPSRITSSDSLDDAQKVASALGIRLETVAINGIFNATQESLSSLFAGLPSDVTEENMQARARMMILMSYANKFHHIVLTTGNKSENSVGYATLHGDMAGGFNPIKDLYKTEVWDLCKWRNSTQSLPSWFCSARSDNPVIPISVLVKPPSAELSEGQTDEKSLGPYPVLDEFLRELIDNQVGTQEALRRVTARADVLNFSDQDKTYLNKDYAEKVAKLTFRAEHKRRQAAPGPKIGPRAFGRDRRYPIVNLFMGL